MPDPLTIAYVGNFGPRHSTENHVAISLRGNGHTVVPLQEDQLHAGELGGWEGLADTALDHGADLVLWTRTWQHLNPEVQEQALCDLRAAGVPTASYHLDLYVGLDREEQIGREAFWRTDVVCTADGALSSDEWAARFGVNHRWVRAGVLAQECTPGRRQAVYASDVAFVGSHRRYHAEWPYRTELVAHLSEMYGGRFKRWPRGQRAVRNEALNDLYASAKVIVGDSLCVGFDRPRYWSDRVYETIGRGGFLVHPYIEGMADEFVDGEHLRFYPFGDWAELRRLIDYYLVHDDERTAIAQAGQAHVREHCTYTQRTQEMIAHVLAQPPLTATPRIRSHRIPLDGGAHRVQLRAGTTDAEVFREVFAEGTYKAAEPYLPGGVVLDVGANVGAFSLWALSRGARHVVAYEPEPGNFAQLVANTEAVVPRVQRKSLAVGAADGHLYLAPGPGGVHGGGTHVVHPSAEVTDAEVRVEVVGVNQVLADALAAHQEIAVWKMDVEGAEYGIIDGLDPELLTQVRCLVMEFHGPGMPHLPHLLGAAQFGPMVAKLAEYGHVTTMGMPSRGGVLTWRRY